MSKDLAELYVKIAARLRRGAESYEAEAAELTRPPTMAEETLENPHLHTSGGDPRCDICVALIGL